MPAPQSQMLKSIFKYFRRYQVTDKIEPDSLIEIGVGSRKIHKKAGSTCTNVDIKMQKRNIQCPLYPAIFAKTSQECKTNCPDITILNNRLSQVGQVGQVDQGDQGDQDAQGS